MNQILFSNNNASQENKKMNKSKKRFFQFLLFFCSFAVCSLASYYAYSLYNKNEKEDLSKKLVNNFNIANLYASDDYNSVRTSSINLYETDHQHFSVIGLIEINSIHITYPILSTVNEDLLKIAPCRFYGPMPNEIGNMCIAGHNYNSYKFFSKIKNLKAGDKINIYDLSGKKLEYSVYNSYETDADDFSCTNQDTNGKREITLITCNNIKNRRRIVKAYEFVK